MIALLRGEIFNFLSFGKKERKKKKEERKRAIEVSKSSIWKLINKAMN